MLNIEDLSTQIKKSCTQTTYNIPKVDSLIQTFLSTLGTCQECKWYNELNYCNRHGISMEETDYCSYFKDDL